MGKYECSSVYNLFFFPASFFVVGFVIQNLGKGKTMTFEGETQAKIRKTSMLWFILERIEDDSKWENTNFERACGDESSH